MAQKSRFPFVTAVIFIIGLAGAFYLGTRNKNENKSSPAPTASIPTSSVAATLEPTSVAEPTTTEVAGGKTYTNTGYGFSFAYPDGYKVEERVPGFIVVSLLNEHVPQAGISLDARLNEPNDSVGSAEASILSSLDISKDTKVGGWQVYEGAGKQGMIKGTNFKEAIMPYKTGVIRAETIAVSPYAETFEQILSSFKLVK